MDLPENGAWGWLVIFKLVYEELLHCAATLADFVVWLREVISVHHFWFLSF